MKTGVSDSITPNNQKIIIKQWMEWGTLFSDKAKNEELNWI